MSWWDDFFTRSAKPLRWFKDCGDLESGKKLYKELMLKYHPDRDGGSAEICKEINAEWDVFKISAVRRKSKRADESGFEYEPYERERVFTEAFFKKLSLACELNCDVEVIGRWIWLFDPSPGDLLTIVAWGFTKSKKRENTYFWFDHDDPLSVPKTKGQNWSIGQMRDFWGSQTKRKKMAIGKADEEIEE